MNIKTLKDLGLSEVTMDTGTVLITEGQPSKNVYVMASGNVEVTARGQRLATINEPGTVFGEVSVLLSTQPVATITTKESSTFYVISDFMDFVRKHPDACVSVAQVLACRLINTNNHLVYVKEQIAALQEGLAAYVPAFPEKFET